MQGILDKILNYFSQPSVLVVLAILVLFLILVIGLLSIINEYKRPNFTINNSGETVTTVKSTLSIESDKSILLGSGIKPIGVATSGVAPSDSYVSENKKGKKEEENTDTRFYMLEEIDKRFQKNVEYDFDDNVTLKELCDDFREYASSRLRLYYSIDDIRRFISSLATSHILILQGMSGTGKTSLAYAFGEYIKNPSTIVPIQPMWKERTDLLGYYNEFTKKFNETTLLCKIYEANYNDNIYITVLDEMNIARVEYYFAEFLSLLEIPNLDTRYLDVVTDKWETDPKLLKEGKVKLPINMWFIGTANNDDSTFAISDKVYDRAMVINLDNKSNAFDGKYMEPKRISSTKFLSLVTEAKKEYRITRRSLDRIKRLDSYMIEKFHITFGNRIMKQIKEYIPVYISCGGKENEAIDDILSRKVIRKLEALNPVYVRNNGLDFIKKLDDIFGNDELKLCKNYIEQLTRVS